MNTQSMIEKIQNTATECLDKELKSLQEKIPSVVQEYVDDYADTLILALFGVHKDRWGDVQAISIPEEIKEVLMKEALQHLPKVTLNKKDIAQLNKAYKDSLVSALKRQMHQNAQEDAQTIIVATKTKLKEDLGQILDLDHFVKTLNFMQQMEKTT